MLCATRNPLLLALLGSALVFASSVGCGIGKEELERDYLSSLRKENKDLKDQVDTLQKKLDSEASALRGDMTASEKKTDASTTGKINALDTKFAEYKRDAETFKSLTSDIDKLRERNIQVYKKLRELLEGQKRAIEVDRVQLRQRGEILVSLAQTLQGILESLGEFTGGASGDGSGSNGGGGETPK